VRTLVEVDRTVKDEHSAPEAEHWLMVVFAIGLTAFAWTMLRFSA
jgi:hypothetical protein